MQEKALSGPHKARKGLRKKCYDCTQLAPAALEGTFVTQKTKVVTEGKAGIFNDLPAAHVGSRSHTVRGQLDSSQPPTNHRKQELS